MVGQFNLKTLSLSQDYDLIYLFLLFKLNYLFRVGWLVVLGLTAL